MLFDVPTAIIRHLKIFEEMVVGFRKRRLQAGSGIRRSGRNRTLYRTIEQRAKKSTAADGDERGSIYGFFFFVKTGRSGYHGTITKERRNVAIAIAERRTLCGTV